MNKTRTLKFHIVVQVILFLVLTGTDQLTKMLAVSGLKGQNDIPVIPDAVLFHYLENTGAAFGIFQNSPWVFYCFTILILLVILFLYIVICRKLSVYSALDPESFSGKTFRDRIFLNYILVILAAGAVGNLIDRILYGYVIDFIYFRFIHFPVFNFADICVTLSAITLIIFFLFRYKEDENFHLFRKSGK